MRKIQTHWLAGVTLALLLMGILGIQADQGAFFQVTEKISADEGGVATLTHNGVTYARFVVEPGTINEDIELSVQVYIDKVKGKFQGFAVDFGPDGLQFNPPYGQFIVEKPLLKLFKKHNLVLWDEYGNELWHSPTIQESTKQLTFRFKHFSLYYFERR